MEGLFEIVTGVLFAVILFKLWYPSIRDGLFFKVARWRLPRAAQELGLTLNEADSKDKLGVIIGRHKGYPVWVTPDDPDCKIIVQWAQRGPYVSLAPYVPDFGDKILVRLFLVMLELPFMRRLRGYQDEPEDNNSDEPEDDDTRDELKVDFGDRHLNEYFHHREASAPIHEMLCSPEVREPLKAFLKRFRCSVESLQINSSEMKLNMKYGQGHRHDRCILPHHLRSILPEMVRLARRFNHALMPQDARSMKRRGP